MSADRRPEAGELLHDQLAGQVQPAPTLRDRKVAVLRHFHGLGYSLRDCAHPRRMGATAGDLGTLADLAGNDLPRLPDAER